MRRNRNVGRVNRGGGGGGGGVGIGSLNLSGGPLLTEHLKDIDLELELLKRKREMYERQQFIQPYNPQPQRNYTQVQHFYDQNEPKQRSSNCDFSHLYEDGQQYRKPFAKKRHSDSDWQHDSYPKRSSGHGPRGPGPAHTRNPRPYNGPSQQPKAPPSVKYGQGRFAGPRPSNQKQQKPKVLANKITKPTKAPAASAPMKAIASQPVAERSTLVAAAVKSVVDVETRDQEARRLLPDKAPTKQMTGRLELALGAILREVRELYQNTPQEDVLRTLSLQRVIKQTIRDRIRDAMLGKVVGATVEIIKEYRDKFPKETDIEIVNKALEIAGVKPAGEPGHNKIEKEKPDEYFKEKMSALITSHLQEMFNKIEEIYNPPANNEGETTQLDFTQDNLEPAVKAPEVPKAAEGSANISGQTVAADIRNVMHPNDYKRMLPRLLKRHIPTILKLLHLNKMYSSAVADLNKVTREKYVEYGKNLKEKGQETPGTAEDGTTAPQNKYIPPHLLPYFVKVMGKPQLPKKKLMQTFLEVFHPKSIKKHRTIHNLLFIGFADKNDSDEILKADGTVIGRSTLSIRVCYKTAPNPGTEGNTTNGDSANVNTENNSNKDETSAPDLNKSTESEIIGSELDNQITDLLATIRNAEEEKKDENSDVSIPNVGEEKVNDNSVVLTPQEAAADDNTDPNAEATDKSTDQTVQEVKTEDAVIEPVDKGQNSDVITQPTSEKPAEITDAEVKENENCIQQANGEPVEENPVGEKNDHITELKNTVSGRSTPTRASSRLSNAPVTPSSIRTRRASRLQN